MRSGLATNVYILIFNFHDAELPCVLAIYFFQKAELTSHLNDKASVFFKVF